MDPMTAMMMASIGQKAMGGKQLGGMAPAPMLGGGPGVGVDSISQLARENNFGQGGIIGGLPQAMQNLPQSADQKVNEKKPVTDETSGQSGFGGFLGNIDSTLSSPSKTLGIGLLGRMHPNLALAGLLASGFWNQQ